jgi:hypothetical protein
MGTSGLVGTINDYAQQQQQRQEAPMASDQGTMDPEIFNHGEHIATVSNGSAAEVERYVRDVATLSGQRVDWHPVGGRAIVKALGDLAAARAALHRVVLPADAWMREIQPGDPPVYVLPVQE